jgi:hypothetical protein
MMTLNISKLRNEVEEREKKKINTFEKVLDMCFKKILHSNQNYSDYYCTFVVPNVVFGLPLYNIVECCGFIIEKLVEKGFEVYLAVPTSLHISWKPKDKVNNNSLQLQYNNSDISSNKQIAIKSKNSMQNNNNNIQHRPIDDYKQSRNTTYDSNDLEIFRNKLDNLFD